MPRQLKGVEGLKIKALLKPPVLYNRYGYRIRLDVLKGAKASFGVTNAEEIAAKSGVALHTVRELFNGTQQNPQIKTLVAVCRLLGLKLDDVIEMRPEET